MPDLSQESAQDRVPADGPPSRPGSTHRPFQRPANDMEERPSLPSETLTPPASTPPVSAQRRRFPGMASQVKHARRFVEQLLAASPECSTATLLTSELATNAITHSGSGTFGGKFEVTIYRTPNWARVEVRDLGSQELPRAQHRGPYDTSEHGRGLDLVEAMAAKWGSEDRPDGIGRMVWFELAWEGEEPGPSTPGADTGDPR